jgi:hypothetical protein
MYENSDNTPGTSQQVVSQVHHNALSKNPNFSIPNSVPTSNKTVTDKITSHSASKTVNTQTDLKLTDFISLKGPKMIYLSIILFCLLLTNESVCSPSKLVKNSLESSLKYSRFNDESIYCTKKGCSFLLEHSNCSNSSQGKYIVKGARMLNPTPTQHEKEDQKELDMQWMNSSETPLNGGNEQCHLPKELRMNSS